MSTEEDSDPQLQPSTHRLSSHQSVCHPHQSRHLLILLSSSLLWLRIIRRHLPSIICSASAHPPTHRASLLLRYSIHLAVSVSVLHLFQGHSSTSTRHAQSFLCLTTTSCITRHTLLPPASALPPALPLPPSTEILRSRGTTTSPTRILTHFPPFLLPLTPFL